MNYEADGKGQLIDYNKLFETEKVLGCAFECSLVNRNSETCESELYPGSYSELIQEDDGWVIKAKNSEDRGYVESYCMVCVPNVGKSVHKKFSIVQAQGVPEDRGRYVHLEVVEPFPTNLVEEFYDGPELLRVDTSKFLYSNDPKWPVKKCRLLRHPGCTSQPPVVYQSNRVNIHT